jgi:uncharacterized damage-inducible protein DinB
MKLNEAFIAELKHESAQTKKILERVPDTLFDYKPHEKSMTMKALATHLAEIPAWIEPTISGDEIDFGKFEYNPPVINNNAELMKLFEDSLRIGIEGLKKADDANLAGIWTGKNNDVVVFSMPRAQVIRGMMLSHIIHHRAQLGMYLRLNNIPLPPVYGPTADENR